MAIHKIAIVGGGIAGLATAWFIKDRFANSGDDVSIKIFEQQHRMGGTIGVTRQDGFIVDWGPNGFLDKSPLTLEMIGALRLSDQLIKANDNAANRFIYKKGQLQQIHMHPFKFMTSNLLSLFGRLRLAAEPFIATKSSTVDETIWQFAARRMGSEAADTLITPMVHGIFGGDAKQLSLAACFPKMIALEETYGSLIKGMIAKKKQSQTVSAGPAGTLTTLNGGMHTLVETLEAQFANDIIKGIPVDAITLCPNQEKRSLSLGWSYGSAFFDTVVLACPLYEVAKLTKAIASKASAIADNIPYVGMVVVAHGYDANALAHPINGFGFLVAPNEDKQILGCIATSNIFPHQAPDGKILLRTMLPISAGLPTDDAYWSKIAQDDLKDVMGITAPPCFEKVFQFKRAIPQYQLGHLEAIAKLEADLLATGNIYLSGNAYEGVGINDVIKRAKKISGQIAKAICLPPKGK